MRDPELAYICNHLKWQLSKTQRCPIYFIAVYNEGRIIIFNQNQESPMQIVPDVSIQIEDFCK